MTISNGTIIIRRAMDLLTQWRDEYPVDSCIMCGCTQEMGCPEGCSWLVDPREELGEIRHGLCDVCHERVQILCETPVADLELAGLGHDILRGASANTLLLALRCVRGQRRKWLVHRSIRRRFP